MPAKALRNKEGLDGLGGVEEAGDESPAFSFMTLQTKEKNLSEQSTVAEHNKVFIIALN